MKISSKIISIILLTSLLSSSIRPDWGSTAKGFACALAGLYSGYRAINTKEKEVSFKSELLGLSCNTFLASIEDIVANPKIGLKDFSQNFVKKAAIITAFAFLGHIIRHEINLALHAKELDTEQRTAKDPKNEKAQEKEKETKRAFEFGRQSNMMMNYASYVLPLMFAKLIYNNVDFTVKAGTSTTMISGISN